MVTLLKLPADQKLAVRDAAILELFYATGLRVSELVSLKKSDVNLDAGFVVASGKRSKERIVPIGSYAREMIKLYLKEMKPKGPFLFPGRQGKPITRQAVWKLIRKYGLLLAAGAPLSPYAAPYLRHPPARRRRRPPLGAAAPRPRGHLHDTDLHARGPQKAERAAQEVPPARGNLLARPG